jgi:large conductance mechanosensitive channel
VLDLAIGIIIGTAFQNVVKSLVDDIITPPFGLVFDGVDFSNLTIKLPNFVHKGQPPVVIRYGLFLQQIIHLLVMALALFFIVKFISRLHRIAVLNRQLAEAAAANEISEPSAPSEPSEELKVLREIRDLIAGNKNVTISSSTASSSIESSSHLITL